MRDNHSFLIHSKDVQSIIMCVKLLLMNGEKLFINS